jgi:hypothetical protein
MSDRGTYFTTYFWTEFCRLLGIKLKLSSAYHPHPQTDGQTEHLNKVIEVHLRSYVNYQQDNRAILLPIADVCANALPSECIGLTPFFANHGDEVRIDFDVERLTNASAGSTTERFQRERAGLMQDCGRDLGACPQENSYSSGPTDRGRQQT